MRYQWVGLLTDYGRPDGFVAACHGVIAQIAPRVRIIDITHDVPAQDVRHGAAVLAQTVPYLPPAVLVAVVDPGVGTSRRAVAVTAGESVLVGPDNGLLGWAADALGGVTGAVSLVAREYHLPNRSGTFDGRDVFAPVAAHVCMGTPVGDLGEPIDETSLVRLPDPGVDARTGELVAEVLTVDHFGNVQLAARADDLDAASLPERVVVVAGKALEALRAGTFGAVEVGRAVLYVDSAGQVAVAVNQGSAAEVLGVRSGSTVTVRRPD